MPEAVHAAVAELEAGKLVLLPDETGWNLVGLAIAEQAGKALSQVAGGSDSLLPALNLPDPAMVRDYLREPTPLFQKLAARCWPGPVLLRCGSGQPDGLSRQFPAGNRDWALNSEGRVFSCPAHPFTREVLARVSAPLIGLIGPESSGVYESAGEDLTLLIRTSENRFESPPTVVATEGNELIVERAGVVSERMLSRLAGEVYLFVCTGNTCRSPMAEAIFRKMLADRLNCREDELLDHGFTVLSAGLAAYRGAAASPEAVQLLRQSGIDLSGHESQPVTEELLFHSDHILTMTRSHKDALLSAYPELTESVRLLSPHNEDVPDPIGAGLDEYHRCRDEITQHLEKLLSDVDFTSR